MSVMEKSKLEAGVAAYIFSASEMLPIAMQALREIVDLGDDRGNEAGGIALLALARIERELKSI